ncbi:radical SAM protein [Treponema vincentii]|uniref:SPL family radical SAM protein n=1 Tax=Treponema vincentii TaxID=69710 RepID=UPI0020A3B515|nr:radical SAM protein [Treponema vincentii]UTC60121.1 radical SAM protein [Treponema vincentii]
MHSVQAKGILSTKNGMNLYRGCTHGCIYCDSRSDCYQIKHTFEDIEIKENAIELLETALRRKRNKCMIGTGSMTDPYMPLEGQIGMTRKAIETVYRYGFGFTVITKSPLILRDLELLQAVNKKAKCVVQMTLTTYNDKLCKILEPNVAVTSERFAVLKRLRDAGIPTIVWLTPILPFINDTIENIEGILQYCIEAKVFGIICFGMGLTLRDGSREFFYKNLDASFPGLKETYMQRYGNSYSVMSPYNTQLMNLFRTRCKENGIEYNPDTIFSYLTAFEDKQQGGQLELF